MNKPFTTITAMLLVLIALVHLMRLLSGWQVIVAGRDVPMWVSAVGLVVPLLLAALVWREKRQ